jgi:molybdopterin/thiamine biosynthesis adenylyltransferase
LNQTPFILQRSLKLTGTGVQPRDPAEASVHDRTNRLPGFSYEVMGQLQVLLVGAGGLGGEIGHGLVRDGVGRLIVCDQDLVELSNLNRQRFYEHDLYRNKAIQLVRNLQREAVSPIELEGYAMTVQQAIKDGYINKVDLVICGVDNDEARVFMARWGLNRRTPVIFTAVNDTADFGYIFIQTSKLGDACFGCLFPDVLSNKTVTPCSVGSSIDILKTVAGPVLYASGALFLAGRSLQWRYKEINLTGNAPDGKRDIPLRVNCPLCINQKSVAEGSFV